MSGPQQHAQTVLSAALAIVEAVRRDGDPAFAHLLQAFDKASHQPAATPADSRANGDWADENATQRLRSIVAALGMESVVPAGDLTGYEFVVLGLIRLEIECLKEQAALAAAPAVQVQDAVNAKHLVDVVLGVVTAWPAVSELDERSTEKLCNELEAALKGQK